VRGLSDLINFITSVGYLTARENEVELLTAKFYNLHIASIEKFHDELYDFLLVFHCNYVSVFYSPWSFCIPNLTCVASYFKDMMEAPIFKTGHLGVLCHLKANPWYGSQVYKIWRL